MIFDGVEWDENNLSHATRRLSEREIEQAIWNADAMRRHRKIADRVVIESATDGGKEVVVVADIVRDSWIRPVTAWEA